MAFLLSDDTPGGGPGYNAVDRCVWVDTDKCCLDESDGDLTK